MNTGNLWPGWKIERQLGEGSFGKVYEISKEEFGHIYRSALKVIQIPQSQAEVNSVRSEGLDEDSVTVYFQTMVEEIVEEFVLMSEIKGNSNIVSYEDHLVVPRKDAFGWDIYIRMELLTPLLEYIENHDFSVQDIIKLGIDMCSALELCQRYHIIHRDIKPENIFVSKFGDFKLGDFGIARELEKTSSGLSRKGTYSYMAPEVYKGQPYNSSVDIYSLGIVLYRFLNDNRTPFLPPYPERILYSDKEKANLMRISGELIPRPCNASGRLGEIVLKACAYEPSQRFENPGLMKQELQSVLSTESKAEVIYPQSTVSQNKENSREVHKEIISPGTSSKKKKSKRGMIFSLTGLFLIVFICATTILSNEEKEKGTMQEVLIAVPGGTYINTEGETVIDTPYYRNEYFSEGLAAVEKEEGANWGYINTNGEEVIEPKYQWAHQFSEGLAAVQEEKSEYRGYIDKDGKMVITPGYTYAGMFQEGLALVQNKKGGKYGYINTKGEQVIDFQFYQAQEFSEGYAAVQVKKDGKWSYIDTKGELIIPHEKGFSEAWSFSEGLAAVRSADNNMIGYINTDGKLVIEQKYKSADRFSGKVAAVRDDNGLSYIDMEGNILLKTRYYSGSSFRDGLAVVENRALDGKCSYGLINLSDGEVIPCKYGHIFHYDKDTGIYGIQGYNYETIGFVNSKGKWIWEWKK